MVKVGSTECFSDLGKLFFLMVNWFYAPANLLNCPYLPLKMMLNLKKVKIDSKMIILLC
jgi:hypothetical protein